MPSVDAEDCCECRGRMTTWHLLAVCQAPALKEARKRVGKKLRRLSRETAVGTGNAARDWMSETGNNMRLDELTYVSGLKSDWPRIAHFRLTSGAQKLP